MRDSRLAVLLYAGLAAAQSPSTVTPHQVKQLKGDHPLHHAGRRCIGEWGFSALVEADGRRILVDTGARPRTVLDNARELKVDLSQVPDVVLTHFHDDYTTGLMTLRNEYKRTNPPALSQIGAHCTGIESLYHLLARVGLTRKTAVVGAVGATFVLEEGIHRGQIAQ